MDVIEKLNKAGVSAKQYSRPPAGKEIFMLGLNAKRDQLLMWPGSAQVRVKTNKRYRQAVLRVEEEERYITRNLSPKSSSYNSLVFDLKLTDTDVAKVGIPHDAAMLFPNLPEKTEFYVEYTSDDRIALVAHVPGSRTHFLVGKDEKTMFVSMLPTGVNSVAEAHEVLRPDSVPEGSPRQGEWFFVPVEDWLADAIDEAIELRRQSRPLIEARYEQSGHLPYSDHHAENRFSSDLGCFVYGRITHPRHKTLTLKKWHRAVHNREIQSSQARRWD